MSKLWKNWTVHNLFAHPAMELCSLVGLRDLGNWIHDATVPEDGDE